MKEQNFRDLLIELIDENPFAIRATLKILHTEFTEKVSTLSVTCEDRPRLLVNLSFVSLNCKTDDHVKALICHEFLHSYIEDKERNPDKISKIHEIIYHLGKNKVCFLK